MHELEGATHNSIFKDVLIAMLVLLSKLHAKIHVVKLRDVRNGGEWLGVAHTRWNHPFRQCAESTPAAP